MPKVKSYAPSWLTGSAPGHKLFAASPEQAQAPPSSFSSLSSKKKSLRPSPRRTIARRGTEVFVAVGREIRWADLVDLKEAYESKHAGFKIKRGPDIADFDIYVDEKDAQAESESPDTSHYRTIKTPVANEIRQLIMSPYGDYLAVLTAHTVHICILPDSTQLRPLDPDRRPLKAPFKTLGPTTHVTSRSAVVSAIWHPFGVASSSLVTVTEDAIVRVWELSTADKWPYDSPTLAIDLRKLADGTSLDQDFSSSTAATNLGFSPDAYEMEVAAACFGGRGTGGWSPMTLWIAMRNGDVYALCPLLPTQWAPPPTFVPALTVSIVAKMASLEDDAEAAAAEKMLVQQQLEWLAEVDSQEPRLLEGPLLGEPPAEVYTRPARPGSVPRLQGPFEIQLDIDEDEAGLDVELSDIYAIGEKLNTTDLMVGEEDEELEMGEIDQEGLSLTILCLLSTSGLVRICLDDRGVEAQWLPPRDSAKISRLSTSSSEPPSLLLYQAIDTLKPSEVRATSWPVFSEDVTSRYSFFITHNTGLTHVSLSPWVFRMESELQADTTAGLDLRVDLLARGEASARSRIYMQPADAGPLAACVAIRDPDLGYSVFSATPQGPIGLVLEAPDEDLTSVRPSSMSPAVEQHDELPRQPLQMWDPRPLFQPSATLERPTRLYRWLEVQRSGKRLPLLQKPTRLSPEALNIFTDAHRLVCAEVESLNEAVAELFRKCISLQDELKQQVVKASEVKQRVASIAGDDGSEDDPSQGLSDKTKIQRRLEAAQATQMALADRVQRLRRNLGGATARDLSNKEKAWAEEVRTLAGDILGPDAQDDTSGSYTKSTTYQQRLKQPWERLEELKRLKEEITAQVEKTHQQKPNDQARDESPSDAALKVPAQLRKQKVAYVMELLEKESTLLDAVKGRLERLTIA